MIYTCLGINPKLPLQHVPRTLTQQRPPKYSPIRPKTMASSSHQWLIYAISSGACAAINGVFAKLYDRPHLLHQLSSSSIANFLQHNNNPNKHPRLLPRAPLRPLPQHDLRAPGPRVLLRPEPALRRDHVGLIHAGTDAGRVDSARQRVEYEH